MRADPASGAGGRRRQEIQTFPTFSAALEALADWLEAEGVARVVMEATGQYWKPIWNVLEGRGLELLLVNARHVKIVPGRKSDVADAAWLAELLEHGLPRGRFVPHRRTASSQALYEFAHPYARSVRRRSPCCWSG